MFQNSLIPCDLATLAAVAHAELFLSVMNDIHQTTRPMSHSEATDDCSFPSIHGDHLWPAGSSHTSASTSQEVSPTPSTTSISSTSSSHYMTTRSGTKVKFVRPKPRKTDKKSESQRIDILKRESLIGRIGPHEVWCRGCSDFVALDSSRQYAVCHWQRHKDLYHVPGGKMYEKEFFLRNQIGQDIKLFHSKRRPRSTKHSNRDQRNKRSKDVKDIYASHHNA